MIELKKNHSDLANYLYHECRCAVAHASEYETTYDPESIEDNIRFYKIYPIAIALAKLVIKNDFGIKTTFTIIGEHLYELDGFKQLFGEDVSNRLTAGKTLFRVDIKLNIKISMRLWNKKKFKAFENLSAKVLEAKNGIVKLELTRDGRVVIPIALDFPKENFIFDPMIGVNFSDDGSGNAAAQFADAYRFIGEMIANGVLEVWDVTNNLILGRLLEYIPVNIVPGQTRNNLIAEEKTLRQIAKERSSLSNSSTKPINFRARTKRLVFR